MNNLGFAVTVILIGIGKKNIILEVGPTFSKPTKLLRALYEPWLTSIHSLNYSSEWSIRCAGGNNVL